MDKSISGLKTKIKKQSAEIKRLKAVEKSLKDLVFYKRRYKRYEDLLKVHQQSLVKIVELQDQIDQLESKLNCFIFR